MFEESARVRYGKSPLLEVVCQLRFPTILSISAQEPAGFQETVRADFPRYEARQDQPAPRITGAGTPNPVLQPQKPVTNYHFLSEDGIWRLNLTNYFIALTCRRYTSWEEFAGRLDQALAGFIRTYQPAYFERVGLRYLNAVSRKALGLEGTPWRELIAPACLGILQAGDVAEAQVSRCAQDVELGLTGGCRLKLHTGPGLVRRGDQPQDQEVRWILDMDLSLPGKLPVNRSAPALQMLHMHAGPIFRSALQDALYDALEPTILE
ncbi:MAG: TIGR04255 family protein [Oscillospiraceae bacterium]|nr:TIGR04255 family protein [Oscillospiraceae bacterium]